MSTDTKKNAVDASAWDNDRKFGNRLTTTFDKREQFLLLAGTVTDDTIQTVHGDQPIAMLLVRKLDENGVPVGSPFEVSAIQSAIVDKVGKLRSEDTPAVVCWNQVPSGKRGRDVAVLEYHGQPGNADTTDLLAKYGVKADETSDPLAGFAAA